jgi:hypothetical protein
MLFHFIFLCLVDICLAIVARAPDPAAAAGDVCKTGIYAKLAPLASYAPAQSFCAKKYPKTTTITVAAKVERTAATTTKPTSTTTKPPSTTTAKTTTARTTTSAQCDLACLFSSAIGNAEQTVSLITSA